MGGRYWITGVQLGMLLAFTKDGGIYNETMEVGEEIMKQDLEITAKTESSHSCVCANSRGGE